MKYFFLLFVLLVQQVSCQNSTEEMLLTFNETTISEDLELTTSYYIDINSTNDTTEILMPTIHVSPPVQSVLREIFRTYKPYCWRHSYNRGIGRPLHTCPDHAPEQDGLICYPLCRDGYNGVGPMCWEKCSNLTSFGLVCVGVRLSERSCPWYDKCGIVRNSCVSCPTDYTKLGCFCGRLHLRGSYGRGVGSAMTCSESYDENAAFCYKKCNKGYNGVGPVCLQSCPSTHPVSCFAGCSTTNEICRHQVIDIVKSVIGSAMVILKTVVGLALISVTTLDILSDAAQGDWISVAENIEIIAGKLADTISSEVAKRFPNWSGSTVESAVKNASLILTGTAFRDQNILAPFLKYLRFDSVQLAFNHGKCELYDDDDDLELI